MLIAIYQEFGANALDVAKEVRKKIEESAKHFPPGLIYTVPMIQQNLSKLQLQK